MIQTPRALTVGHITLDRYDQNKLRPGGSVLYAALTWKALNFQTHIVTSLGEDFFKKVKPLTGLELSVQTSKETTIFANEYSHTGERTQLLEALADPISPPSSHKNFLPFHTLFLAPVMAEIDLEKWITFAKEAPEPVRIGLGLQGLIRKTTTPFSDWPGKQQVLHSPFVVQDQLLNKIDVIFMSESEADAQKGLREHLCKQVETLIVTCGAKGALLYKDNKVHKIPAFKTQEVDPTGAGDTFAAGFLYAAEKGMDSVQAAIFGSAAASFVVEIKGAGNFADEKDIKKRIEAKL